MLKKILLWCVCIILGGCGMFSKKVDRDLEYKGTAKSNEVDTYKIVEVTIKDNQIIKVSIDEKGAMSFDGTRSGSKKELGDDYAMKQFSDIDKEWHEQVKALEDYIVTNGVETIHLDFEGRILNEDMVSMCTIDVSKFVELTKTALKNAQNSK